MADDDDEFTVVVHEQVEKAMQRVSRRFVAALFVATGVPAVVYLTLHDYLYAYLPTNALAAAIGAAISCRSPLFYMVQDVCRLYELRPTDGSVLARLVTVAASAVPGLAVVAFYATGIRPLSRGRYSVLAKAIPTDWAVGTLGGVQYRGAGISLVGPFAKHRDHRARAFAKLSFRDYAPFDLATLQRLAPGPAVRTFHCIGRRQAISCSPSAARRARVTIADRRQWTAMRASSMRQLDHRRCGAYRLRSV
jgi:hypothetical protein